MVSLYWAEHGLKTVLAPGPARDDEGHCRIKLTSFLKPQTSIYNTSPMSLSSDAPLKVLRDYIVSAAEAQYIGKIVTICAIFLVCYDWRKFWCCSLKRTLILFPSHISR